MNTDVLLTRATLLQRVRQQRDQESWQEFANAYAGYIYNIASRMGLPHHDAEEVGQNVMLQLWKKMPEFKYDPRKGKFRGWLYTVTANETRAMLHRRSRDLDRLSPLERETLHQAIETAQTTQGENFAQLEWVNYVTALAWERVQPMIRGQEGTAFEMLSKGMSVEQVAQELHITESSVYVYKKRVKDLLTTEIKVLNRDLD